jgi:FixJ family two-component response regulator
MVGAPRPGHSEPVTAPLPSICVVDDDPSVLKSLGRLLHADGHASLGFEDPAGFIEHAATQPVALAIVDFLMPGLNGLQVLDSLRRLSPRTHLVLISASDEPGIRWQALNAGARAFFRKPFEEEALLKVVRDVLSLPSSVAMATPPEGGPDQSPPPALH